MALTRDAVIGPLIVAGIVGMISLLFRISLQMESFRGEVTSVKVEVRSNRALICRMAQKQDIIAENCL